MKPWFRHGESGLKCQLKHNDLCECVADARILGGWSEAGSSRGSDPLPVREQSLSIDNRLRTVLLRRVADYDERLTSSLVTFLPMARQKIESRAPRFHNFRVARPGTCHDSVSLRNRIGQPARDFLPPTERPTRLCPEKLGTATAGGLACGRVVKSLPDKCGLRSLVRRQFVVFRTFEISTPLRRTASNISAPFDSMIMVSSVGSPETDRGPPCS